MRRFAFHLVLLLGLLLQAVVAVGDVMPHEEQQQHCAGHYSDENCACCPDGAANSVSCTAQCSVSQAPLVMLALDRVVSHGERVGFIQTIVSNPAYAPLVPPPIR